MICAALSQEQLYEVLWIHHFELGAVHVPVVQVRDVTLFYLRADFLIDGDMYMEKFPDYMAALERDGLYTSVANDVRLRGTLGWQRQRSSMYGSRFTLTVSEVLEVRSASSGKHWYAFLCDWVPDLTAKLAVVLAIAGLWRWVTGGAQGC